jgi:hypothetical protein
MDFEASIRGIVREEIAKAREIESKNRKLEVNKAAMTPKEVEKYFGIKSSHLGVLRSTGKGPAFSKIGKSVIYQRDDVEKFIKNRRIRTIDQRD